MHDQIREHMEVIGADGVHLGTVDKVEGNRIKLTRADSEPSTGYGQGGHAGHHHYVALALVAGIDGDAVRLSANADVAATMEEEAGGANIADDSDAAGDDDDNDPDEDLDVTTMTDATPSR
jgi:hypothetical protein